MLKTMTLTSLAKVFSGREPENKPLQKFSMLQNERSCFQVAVFSDEDVFLNAQIKGDFAGKSAVFAVEELPSELPVYPDTDDYVLSREPGMFPDLLRPLVSPLKLQANQWRSIWVELMPEGTLPAGNYSAELVLSGEGLESIKINSEIEIIGTEFPEQTFPCTHWLHTDCISNYYGVEVFSEEYWQITERFVKMAAGHGINMLLTPLFTPPLDTGVGSERPTVQLVDVEKKDGEYFFGFEKLERWIEMFDRCGIKYFEMSHLFTQWGARNAPKIVVKENGKDKKMFGWKTRAGGKDYVAFLTAFSKAVTAFIDEKGIRGRCFFHVSDEPGLQHFRSYKKKAKIIAALFPGFTVIDALSDYNFYRSGAVRHPVCAIDHIEPFIGKAPELWAYYCCGQQKDYVSNRFFSMPSQRNRVLGTQLYKFEINGFLQWGYNYWYSRFSAEEVDPFLITDAKKAFPSGDAFVVYPGENGEPLPSLRLKVFRDAIQDYRALTLLESLIGREKTMALINETAPDLTFKNYPHSDEWQLSLRENINRLIKENLIEKDA